MKYPDPNYFDYSASMPPFEMAMEEFREISLQYFANPSSIHRAGQEAKIKLLELKSKFCELLHFYDGRILLCSSGTEANNTIIEGHRKRFPQGRILIAKDTHQCIWYARKKYPAWIDVLDIDRSGKIDLYQLSKAIRPGTTLVCVSHVCNELGTIHPVSDIADICADRECKLLIDGAQAIGHIPVDMRQIWANYYTFSAHKFGGPRSVGGIFIRDDHFESLLFGGRQEWELRAGTENLPGLAASHKALDQCLVSIESERRRLSELRDHFLRDLRAQIPGMLVNSSTDSLPGFTSLSLPGFSGNEIVTALSLHNYSVSTGSACHANQISPSRIILAMGRSEKEARGTIRISMGRGTTNESVQGLRNALIEYLI